MTPLALRGFGILLASALISHGTAHAIDLPAPGPEIQHVAVDSSSDVSSFGGSSDLNGTVAPLGSINESGFRLRVTGSVSWYKFITNDSPRTFGSGRTFEQDLLAGYEIATERFNVIGLIGAAAGESVSGGVTRTQAGVKGVVSSYATPTDETMTYNSFTYSSIDNFSQLQSKVGVKISGNLYLGPEVNFSWRDQIPSPSGIAQMLVGVHLSGWEVGPLFFSVSGGWAHDRQIGSGQYISLNVYGSF